MKRLETPVLDCPTPPAHEKVGDRRARLSSTILAPCLVYVGYRSKHDRKSNHHLTGNSLINSHHFNCITVGTVVFVLTNNSFHSVFMFFNNFAKLTILLLLVSVIIDSFLSITLVVFPYLGILALLLLANYRIVS